MISSESFPDEDLSYETVAGLVDDVSCLVSPPDVCVKVFDLLESNSASAQNMADVISHDPSLTAKLLRLVNSAFYGFPRRIDTVSRAITIVGIQELYNLIVAVTAVKSFNNLPNTLVSADTFWRHGVYTGLVARALAKQCGVLHPERLFVAGMLHDVGSLVIYNRLPEKARDFLLIAGGDEGVLNQAEHAELGFTHADLGASLMELWMLPETLQESVCYHHMPSDATEAGFDASLVHLADNLANRSQVGAYCEQPDYNSSIDPWIWETLGLDEAKFDEEAATLQASQQFSQTATLMLARA